MPENEKTNNDPGKADKKDDRTSHAGLWWICIARGDFQRQLWRLPYDASFDHQRRRFKDRLSDTFIEPAQ